MLADIRYARRHPMSSLETHTRSSLTGLGLFARIQGKFSDGQRVKRLNKFLFLHSFLSLEDAFFLLYPWFSHEDFYTVMSFNEASEDTRDLCFSLAVCGYSHCSGLSVSFTHFPLHLPNEGKCQNTGRPEMTDRRRRPEMMDERQHARR